MHLRAHSARSIVTIGEHSWHPLGTLWESGCTLGILRDHSEITKRSLRDHAENTQFTGRAHPQSTSKDVLSLFLALQDAIEVIVIMTVSVMF